RRKRNLSNTLRLSGRRGPKPLIGRGQEPPSPKTPKFADTPRVSGPSSVASPTARPMSVDMGTSSQLLSPTLRGGSYYRRGHGSLGDLDDLETLTRVQRVQASEEESVSAAERDSSLAE